MPLGLRWRRRGWRDEAPCAPPAGEVRGCVDRPAGTLSRHFVWMGCGRTGVRVVDPGRVCPRHPDPGHRAIPARARAYRTRGGTVAAARHAGAGEDGIELLRRSVVSRCADGDATIADRS